MKIVFLDPFSNMAISYDPKIMEKKKVFYTGKLYGLTGMMMQNKS